MALYAIVDPSTHFFPRCMFLSLTGLECPGCGSQRAIHSMLTGNIAQAWHYNAFLVTAFPIIILMVVASLMRHRMPGLYNTLNSTKAIILWAVAVLAWWIGRNCA